MRAVEMVDYGGPDQMRVNADRPLPGPPGPGQILVRVAAAGINPVDWKIRAGILKRGPLTFPAIMGAELAGTVEALGEKVTDFAIGDEVHGAPGMGAFADYVLLDAAASARIPKTAGLVAAAVLPVAAATSVAALNSGEVGKGTRILVYGASGGVGTIAVQLARIRGAEITALASPANFDFLKRLGATHVVDRTGDFENQLGEFDVVLNAHGPAAMARSWKLVRKGGILVSIAGPPPEGVAEAHGVRAVMVFGVVGRAVLGQVNDLVDAGDVKIFVSRSYPVEQAAMAMAECEAGKVRGKLALTF